MLQTLLPKHTNVPELYFLLMALFLQQPVTDLPDSLQVHVSIPTFFSSSTYDNESAQFAFTGQLKAAFHYFFSNVGGNEI